MKKMIQKNKAMMVMGGLVCFSGLVDGAEEEKTQVIKLEKSQREEVSKGIAYMKGKELVNDLLKQGFTMEDFSSKAFSEGFSEALNQKASTIKLEDFQVTFNLVKAKLLERELSLSKKNKVKSDQWLSENLKKKGVKTTESGLQYEVIVKGEGKVHSFNKPSQKATEKKRFFIKYLLRNKKEIILEGSPNDKFVGITETPIKGLSEALSLMSVGSQWKLYLKPDLGYGSKRIGAALPPSDVVVLEVILGDVKPVAP